LLARLATRSFLLADYDIAEAFLFKALKLDSSNYLAWSQLGLLFAEGAAHSYQAEECHCLALLAAEGEVDHFTESSRLYLAACDIENPQEFANQMYSRRSFPEAYQEEVDRFSLILNEWPADSPRLGNSRIPKEGIEQSGSRNKQNSPWLVR
jgi:hypothetical protein